MHITVLIFGVFYIIYGVFGLFGIRYCRPAHCENPIGKEAAQ